MSAFFRRGIPHLLFAVLVVATFWHLSLPAAFFPGWPPRIDSEPAQIQLSELALKPGDAFKGRSVTLLDMNHPELIGWGPFHFPTLYYNYRVTFGYEFTNDAQVFGVPVTNEYGHWISPPQVALLTTAFYDPRDYIDRAAQSPRVWRASLARLMGVALVVSDEPIPGEVELYSGMAGNRPLHLTRIANPNRGQYSPAKTVVASSASAMLDLLQAPDFDGEAVAIVEAPLDMTLTAATNVSLSLYKGPMIRINAASAGASLLVLPFDWSYCLQASGEGLVEIRPVNLSQIGLLIQGNADIEIVYRYGLLSGTECRKRDLQRARDLDLENAATGRLFKDTRVTG